MFQSRNRGSCRFKRTSDVIMQAAGSRFNLVIEVLVVSRECDCSAVIAFISVSIS